MTTNDLHRPSRLVLIGPPGSGKGTQAARLAAELEVPAISTGEMLRHAVATGSELGRRAAALLDAGDLVDDETMAELVAARLDEADAGDGFLLDGYPRTLDQAEDLDRILERREQDLDAVLFIDVPPAELIRRALDRQRADDNEATIRNRLQVYRDKTEPLVDLYRRRSLLREVDGHQPVDRVTAAVLSALRGVG